MPGGPCLSYTHHNRLHPILNTPQCPVLAVGVLPVLQELRVLCRSLTETFHAITENRLDSSVKNELEVGNYTGEQGNGLNLFRANVLR